MFYDMAAQSAAYIRERIPQPATLGIILGSGLGALVDIMEEKTVISYGEIPHFPSPMWRGTPGIW